MKKKIEKLKYGLKNNKITTILAFGIILPIAIILLVNEKNVDNILMIFLIVPIVYRIVGNIILKIMVKKGLNESTEYFVILSRIATMITFFVVTLIANIKGAIHYPFIGIILISICMGYFDKFVFFVLQSLFHFAAESNIYGVSESVESMDSLIGNAKTSFKQSDGTTIYQDESGKVIGQARYNEKTGETIYLNSNMGYIGKSSKDSLGDEQYFDSKLNYKGKSVKESNGITSYYDNKSSYKGSSKNNGNTTNYNKK